MSDEQKESRNSKDPEKPGKIEVYKVVASRRTSRDIMVWQTAGFVFTGQAFLYTIALGHQINICGRLVALFLSSVSALATIQVMIRHRKLEERDSRWLSDFEMQTFDEEFHKRLDKSELPEEVIISSKETFWSCSYKTIYNLMLEKIGFLTESSVRIWILLQTLFGLVSLMIFLYLTFIRLGFLTRILRFCGCS